jgi:hypothetical protein
MINKQEQEKSFAYLSEEEQRTLELIASALQEVAKKKNLTDDMVRSLDNAERDLSVIRNKVIWKYINVLKLGTIV